MRARIGILSLLRPTRSNPKVWGPQMTNFADVWSRKSEEQVQDAARHLTEYSADAQSAILNEVSRRGLSFDQTVATAPPPPPRFVECYVRGWKRSTTFRGRAGVTECFAFF